MRDDTKNGYVADYRDSRASETRARVKITPREKRRHAAGREKNFIFLAALQLVRPARQNRHATQASKEPNPSLCRYGAYLQITTTETRLSLRYEKRHAVLPIIMYYYVHSERLRRRTA